MVQTTSQIAEKIKFLPDKPGIYIWKDKNDAVIYVGKAVNLHNRIKSYLVNTAKDAKTTQLVTQIADLEYIITNSDHEAYILEFNLIKQYRPKYNIMLKDDKRYPYLKITLSEPFPRVFVTRDIVKDGSKYFGPYTDTKPLRRTLRLLEWVFPLRNCKRTIPLDRIAFHKACINFQLHKCTAPCIGNISQKEYIKIVRNVMNFFMGKHQDILDDFRSDMLAASEAMQYEEAARLRDRIIEVEKVQKRQSINNMDERNMDIIGFYQEENIAVIVVLRMMNGKILHQENYPLTQIENSTPADMLTAFLKLYYADKVAGGFIPSNDNPLHSSPDQLVDPPSGDLTIADSGLPTGAQRINAELQTEISTELPHEILLPHEPEDFDNLNTWLRNRLILPQRGEKAKLLIMAKHNAFHLVEERKLAHLRKANRTIVPIQELKEKLDLPRLPRKMVCMDISTIQGSDTVSSAVFFENGKPKKKYYRHFIIKTIDTQNDFAAMAETMTRFLGLTDADPDMLPDLIIIDGGKGQLSSVTQILRDSGKDIPLISLAKRVEEIFSPGTSDSIILPRSSSAMRLIVNIRDEAHRFAITFHRSRRSKRTLISELEEIPGIGEQTKFLLLKHFGSVDAVKSATIEELAAVKGMGSVTAEKIRLFFASQHT